MGANRISGIIVGDMNFVNLRIPRTVKTTKPRPFSSSCCCCGSPRFRLIWRKTREQNLRVTSEISTVHTILHYPPLFNSSFPNQSFRSISLVDQRPNEFETPRIYNEFIIIGSVRNTRGTHRSSPYTKPYSSYFA